MSEGMELNRLTLKVEEVAKMLGISRNLAYEMARTGQLPTLRFGRRLLVPRHALERMLEQSGDTKEGANAKKEKV